MTNWKPFTLGLAIGLVCGLTGPLGSCAASSIVAGLMLAGG